MKDLLLGMVVIGAAVAVIGFLAHVEETMTQTKEELIGKLNEIQSDLTDAAGDVVELKDKITALEEALANAGNIPQEITDLVDAIKVKADDLAATLPEVEPDPEPDPEPV